MIRLALVLCVLLSGCYIINPGHGSGGDDDDCLLPPAGDDTTEPAIAPLRNPHTLTCDDFNGGNPCDPACGPCPASDDPPPTPKPGGSGGAALAPIPSWGSCFSSCEGLDENTCGSRSDCRIVKDAACAINASCFTDFMGCFPTDQFVDASVACVQAFDGETCSRNPDCTAFHRPGCSLVAPEDPVPPECTRDFAFCLPEGTPPGQCFSPVTCDAVGPSCPSGSTPGILDGCFTGGCIPEDLCEGQL
jgi:hypothetical protein